MVTPPRHMCCWAPLVVLLAAYMQGAAAASGSGRFFPAGVLLSGLPMPIGTTVVGSRAYAAPQPAAPAQPAAANAAAPEETVKVTISGATTAQIAAAKAAASQAAPSNATAAGAAAGSSAPVAVAGVVAAPEAAGPVATAPAAATPAAAAAPLVGAAVPTTAAQLRAVADASGTATPVDASAAAPQLPAGAVGQASATAGVMEVDLDAGDAAPLANDTAVLKIGCLAPLKGDKAATGQAVKAAIEMAIAQTAAKRLPSGFEVSLLCADTGCTDIGALHAARKLARANVVAIVGDVCTPAAMAAMAVANRFQIPLISPGATSPDLTMEGSYFFRTVPNDRYQGRFVAEQLKKQGAKTVLVAYTPDNYSDRLAFNFVAAFSKGGGSAVPLEMRPGVPGGAAAAGAAVVSMAREEQAQAVFLSTANLTLAAGLIKAIRSADPPLNVTIFGGDALMTPTLAARAGPAAAAGVRGADLWSSPVFRREFESWVASQKDAHPGVPRNVTWNAKAATAYDATIAILDAARRAPPPRRGKQIAKELRNVRFDGKSGLIAFEPGSGDLAYDPTTAYSVGQFQPDGTIAVLPAM